MSILQWGSPDISMDNIDVEFLFISFCFCNKIYPPYIFYGSGVSSIVLIINILIFSTFVFLIYIADMKVYISFHYTAKFQFPYHKTDFTFKIFKLIF